MNGMSTPSDSDWKKKSSIEESSPIRQPREKSRVFEKEGQTSPIRQLRSQSKTTTEPTTGITSKSKTKTININNEPEPKGIPKDVGEFGKNIWALFDKNWDKLDVINKKGNLYALNTIINKLKNLSIFVEFAPNPFQVKSPDNDGRLRFIYEKGTSKPVKNVIPNTYININGIIFNKIEFPSEPTKSEKNYKIDLWLKHIQTGTALFLREKTNEPITSSDVNNIFKEMAERFKSALSQNNTENITLIELDTTQQQTRKEELEGTNGSQTEAEKRETSRNIEPGMQTNIEPGKNFFEDPNNKDLMKFVAIMDSIHDFGADVGYNKIKLFDLFQDKIQNEGFKNIIKEILEKTEQNFCYIDKKNEKNKKLLVEKCFEKKIINDVLLKHISNTNFNDINDISMKIDLTKEDSLDEKINKLNSYKTAPFIEINLGTTEKGKRKKSGIFLSKNIPESFKNIFSKYYNIANPELEINSSVGIEYGNLNAPLYNLWRPSTARIFDASMPVYKDIYNHNQVEVKIENELFEITKIIALSATNYNKNTPDNFIEVIYNASSININNTDCSITNVNPKELLKGKPKVRYQVYVPPIELENRLGTKCTKLNEIVNSITNENRPRPNDYIDARAHVLMDWKRAGDFLQAQVAKDNQRIFITGDRIAWLYACLYGCKAVFYKRDCENYIFCMYNPDIQTKEEIKTIEPKPIEKVDIRKEETYVYYNEKTTECELGVNIPEQIGLKYRNILQKTKNKIYIFMEELTDELLKSNLTQICNVLSILNEQLQKLNEFTKCELLLFLDKTCWLIHNMYELNISKDIVKPYNEFVIKLKNNLDPIPLINGNLNFKEILSPVIIQPNPRNDGGGTLSMNSQPGTPSPTERSRVKRNDEDIKLVPTIKMYYKKRDIIIPFHPIVPLASLMMKSYDSAIVREYFVKFLREKKIRIMNYNYMEYEEKNVPVSLIAEFLIEASTDLTVPLFSDFIIYMKESRKRPRISSEEKTSIPGAKKGRTSGGMNTFNLKDIIMEYLDKVREVRYDVYNNFDLIARMYQYSVYKDIEGTELEKELDRGEDMETSGGSSHKRKKTIQDFENKLQKLRQRLETLYRSGKDDMRLKNEFATLEKKIIDLATRIKEYYVRQKKMMSTKDKKDITQMAGSSGSKGSSKKSSTGSTKSPIMSSASMKEQLEKLQSEYMIYTETYGNKYFNVGDQERFEKKERKYQSDIKKLQEKIKK